jgi:FMN phosphatase YigB (HAD superfamily)
MHVTVDLDDTLIRTQRDYDKAIESLALWLAERTEAQPGEVAERLNEIDRANLSDYGLSRERFLTSFERATIEFLDDPVDEDLEFAQDLASSAYKSEDKYRERGFRDGVSDLLTKLQNFGAVIHLVTTGDETVQQRKIRGLNLSDWVDEITIVGLGEKSELLRELKDDTTTGPVLHIGNSLSSDVETAREAGVKAVYIPKGEWRREMADDSLLEDDVVMFESIPKFLDDFDRVIIDCYESSAPAFTE